MTKLREYVSMVADDVIDELELYARKLSGRAVQNINSTNVGGGVAEILLHMVPLLREMGIQSEWDVIRGGERVFYVTKTFTMCFMEQCRFYKG